MNDFNLLDSPLPESHILLRHETWFEMSRTLVALTNYDSS